MTYYIHTYTGSARGSAADAAAADVYVNLVGELGDTGDRQMLRSDNDVKFQRGQVTVSLASLLLSSATRSGVSEVRD